MFSSIKRKPCKNLECNRPPKLGYNGYCGVKCMPEEEQQKDKWKSKAISNRKAGIKSKNSREVWKSAQETQSPEITAEINAQAIWFKDRRKEMTGKCFFCGGKTEKYNESTFKRSIAHLLAKRKAMFPSVATHKDNWIELCFYGNSCHTNFDNSMIDWEDIKHSYPTQWIVIVAKFKEIYPLIKQEEKRNLPEILINEIN